MNPRTSLGAIACVLFAGALAAACATPPKPKELVAFEQLRREPQTRAAEQAAPNQIRQADHLLADANTEWEDSELESARHLSLLGLAQIKHAHALYNQDDAVKRAKKARKEKAALDDEIERQEVQLEALDEQLALLSRLQEQQLEQARLKEQASAEQQRLSTELESQKVLAEAVEKIKAAELLLKEAETVNAAKYSQANYKGGVDLLVRARMELDSAQLDAARSSADLARQKAAEAIAEAQPQFTQDSQRAQRKQRAEALARDAAVIPMVEVRRDARGSLQRLILHIPATRLFRGSRTTLQEDSEPLMNEIARLLEGYSEYPVQVVGHTDDRGREESLLERSQARAQSVSTALVSRGVDARRLVVTGKGGEEPIGENRGSAGRARNNRVEIVFMYQ